MADQIDTKGLPMVVGANHRSSSMGLRDRLFVEDSAVPSVLEQLRRAGIGQAMVFSTCDRVEIVAIPREEDDTARLILGVMAGVAAMDPEELALHCYVLNGAESVRHLFAVASSLDSLMIGEPQVFGQIKACHRLARDAGMVDSELEAVMQAAYSAAKRVRSETAIGKQPVSMSAAAVQVARDLHGDLDRCGALLIGVGDMGQMVAADMLAAGLGHLTVTHPSELRAENLAQTLDCHVAPFDSLATVLPKADIVIASMGSRQRVLSADMVMASLRHRRRKPVFLVDTAIPGDIEPAVDRIDEAFLYDLNDLERITMKGRASRESEAAVAWRIVDEEAAGFMRGRAERAAVPVLTRLRQHFEEIRESVLDEAGDDAGKATRLLINRLLHAPSQALRETAVEKRRTEYSDIAERSDLAIVEMVLGRLFDLDGKNESRDRDVEESE